MTLHNKYLYRVKQAQYCLSILLHILMTLYVYILQVVKKCSDINWLKHRSSSNLLPFYSVTLWNAPKNFIILRTKKGEIHDCHSYKFTIRPSVFACKPYFWLVWDVLIALPAPINDIFLQTAQVCVMWRSAQINNSLRSSNSFVIEN